MWLCPDMPLCIVPSLSCEEGHEECSPLGGVVESCCICTLFESAPPLDEWSGVVLLSTVWCVLLEEEDLSLVDCFTTRGTVREWLGG